MWEHRLEQARRCVLLIEAQQCVKERRAAPPGTHDEEWRMTFCVPNTAAVNEALYSRHRGGAHAADC